MSVCVWNTVGVQHSSFPLHPEILCNVLTPRRPALLLLGCVCLCLGATFSTAAPYSEDTATLHSSPLIPLWFPLRLGAKHQHPWKGGGDSGETGEEGDNELKLKTILGLISKTEEPARA